MLYMLNKCAKYLLKEYIQIVRLQLHIFIIFKAALETASAETSLCIYESENRR